MKEVILLKYGEIALKGLNKRTFEDILIRNIRRKLDGLGEFDITKAQSTIYIEPINEAADIDAALSAMKKVFGISVLCKALSVDKDFDVISKETVSYLSDSLSSHNTFKVETKRSDKGFPMMSMEISRRLGGIILDNFSNLKVDVHNPELTVFIEVREVATYIYADRIAGAGGIPVGSSGKALLLLSGGIDSPVAGYMMAKRGIRLSAIHFVSPPYTSMRAQEKVERLCEKMVDYCQGIEFILIHFTEIQEQIKKHCPEELFTIILRRMMMRVASKIAQEKDLLALITGESVAQVASQTLSAIACTDNVCDRPVFRPVVGMDKNEIVDISRKIDTYDISIEPYEDCCTVFTPRHPRTNPKLSYVESAEAKFDFGPLIDEAVKNAEYKFFG